MKPLIVLITVFLLGLLWTLVFDGIADHLTSGRISMAAMLIFTAIGHFRFADGMSMMMPDVIPYRKPLIYITGVIEIIAGVGLATPLWTKDKGWLLIIFFLLILPANIYAALRHVDYEKANYEGPGPYYLWFRIPLQLFFIGWTYYFAVLHAPHVKFQVHGPL